MKSHLSISLALIKNPEKMKLTALTILPVFLTNDVLVVLTGGVRVGFLSGQKKA